ncbi:NUDIX hydrolase [Methylocapsa palsarum]|uniref:ADP-ribose pyrophosphatase YjhB, NUDIX family n=1 Tax=Methylocapsa palsarum TaxID=1612308 RepID=A0A1I3ZRK7_9HYPH|nr:NUDIX hydrolase [Methylocapsa palsarum]SFK46607.1 ADP-ribose pyrophosphatase YjhB, NUDIX family [Methylocapsa palsarum]
MTVNEAAAPDLEAPWNSERRGSEGESSERTYPPRPFLAVSIAVFREGRVLLAARTRPPFKGLFSLPGGLVETGESLADAAVRELFEEVRVKAAIASFNRHVESIEWDASGKVLRHYVIASFVGEWLSGEGVPGPEASEIIWADPSRLGLLNCTPQTEAVVGSAQLLLRGQRQVL